MIQKKLTIYAVGAYPPGLGGGELSGLLVLKQLAKLGHHITVFSQEIPGKQPPAVRGIEFVPVKTRRVLDVPPEDFRLASRWRRFSVSGGNIAHKPFVRAVSARIEQKRPDVILVNFGAPYAGFIQPVAKKYGIPSVIVLRGSDVHALTLHGYRTSRAALVAAYNAASGRIAVAEYLKTTLQELGVRDVDVVRNTIDPKQFRPQKYETTREIRRELGIPEHATVFCHVSFLTSVKDPLKIVAAARLAVQQNPNLHFLVVGGGPMHEALEAAVVHAGLTNKFTLTGQVSVSAVKKYVSAADVLVMTSKREGTPRAILEAFALGKPVIASRAGGMPEIVHHEHNGLLFEQANAGDLAAQMLKLTHPEFRKRLARGATVWGKRRTPGKMGEHYNTLIHHIIQRHKKRADENSRKMRRRK